MPAKKAPARVIGQLEQSIKKLLIGQDHAIEEIVPFIETYQANLCMPGRPIAVILLLGPTGSGKTHTVETLAQVLHGNPKSLLRVDCGEYQQDHEVAKLLGAPPGYLGHRETTAVFNKAALEAITTSNCGISLVLFDEIEKGSPALEKLLLGICDKAVLRTGDNTTVSFERSIVFLTSNLGEKEIQRSLNPQMGFVGNPNQTKPSTFAPLGRKASKRKFSPAMINRIDLQLTYRPLQRPDYEAILDRLLAEWAFVIAFNHGIKAFYPAITPAAKVKLLDEGISQEYGARQLKRTLQRHFINPVCRLVLAGQIPPGSLVTLESKSGEFKITVKAIQGDSVKPCVY